MERSQKTGKRVAVVLATPPAAETQGSIEWVVSALWLFPLERLVLYVVDAFLTVPDEAKIEAKLAWLRF